MLASTIMTKSQELRMGFSSTSGCVHLPSVWVSAGSRYWTSLPPLLPAPCGMQEHWCYLPPSTLLEWCSAPLPALQFGSRQPILTIHWDNFLQITLETKDKTAKAWFSSPPARSHMYCAKMWHATPCLADTHHSCGLRAGEPSLPRPVLVLLWCTSERLQLCSEV